LLGEGGMGAVYEGENTLIHRTVAIKVLHSGVAALEEAVKRFEREAQAAGRIGSEHIVEVLDLGRLANGDRYMVMEFLKGEALSGRITARGKLSAAEICAIGIQMLDGLSAAHEAGIIHRDLKPDNVFLLPRSKGRTDFVKILDFGISKFSGLAADFSMTRTGSVMGTPYYMSPEQARGAKNLDARLDVYAAGVILYEAATGRVPFDGDTFNELLFKIVTQESPPVRVLAPELDAGLSAIIDMARQKDPAERYQSAKEFRDALQGWLDGSQSTRANPGAATVNAATPNALVGAAPAAGAAASAATGATAFAATAGVVPAAGALAGTAGVAAGAADPVTHTLPLAAPNEARGALAGNTHQAWANNTAHAAPQPAPSTRGRNMIAAVAGVLLLGGAAMVLKLQGDTANSAARAAATSLAVERQLHEAREEAGQKLLEEQARSRAIEARAEQTRAEMELARTSALEEKAEAQQERQRAADAAKAEAEAQRLKANAAARARVTTRSKSTAPAPAGRKIRTSL
jgi:serine/threonine-protein kinase